MCASVAAQGRKNSAPPLTACTAVSLPPSHRAWSHPAAKSVGRLKSGAMSPVMYALLSTSSTASYCVSPNARSLSQLCEAELQGGRVA